MPIMTFFINSPLGGGANFGSGSVDNLRGERGVGFFRLTMTINFIVEPAGTSGAQPEPPQLAELMAEARLNGRSIGRFTSMPGYLPIRSYPERTNQTSVPLTCDLDRARVEAIENMRSGGHLALDISFNARFGNGNSISFADSYVVNQGIWIDVLAEMGYQRTLLVEVPAPDPGAEPELADAVALLAQAQRHQALGHDRDAVGTLRDVLEQVKLAFGDDDTIDPELNRVLFGNSRSMTKGERLRVLRRALMLVTHPARHRDQVSAAIDWSRIDATQLITMTAAFLNEMSALDARPPQRGPAPAVPDPPVDQSESEGDPGDASTRDTSASSL
jgi:hypothetical protein